MFVVGFPNQVVFASSIGCTRHRVAEWFKMLEPPSTMRRGFDASLARALRTDRFTLFRGFRDVAPGDAPFIDGEIEPPPSVESARRRIAAVAELLPPNELREFARVGEQLLHGQREPVPAA